MWRRALYATLGALWVATAWWEAYKPLPPGTRTRGPWYTMAQAEISIITDLTAVDAYGRPVTNQAIFDETLKLVHQAREFLVLDYYLFNEQHPEADPPLRSLSAELRDALIARQREVPQLKVLFITDPINELEGAAPSSDLRVLRAAGVQVVVTDTERLRDANFMYSSLWRLGIRWWSTGSPGTGWLPDPTDAGISSSVPFGAWAQLLNLKANHRKVIVGDDGHGALVGIVGSADPHDASSNQSNIAARIAGPALQPLLQSELAIARFSGWEGKLDDLPARPDPPAPSVSKAARVRVLTEGEIGEAILRQVQSADPGDSVDIAMYCVADRALVMALLDAARRGVNIRLILDPGKDGFGRPKSGLPNRPVASELVSASDGGIHVRWYRTHGEQFHTKLVMVYGPKHLWLLIGSADLTRHALDDYNLEASVAIEVPREAPVAQQTLDYFTKLWSNPAALGIEYTTDFPLYADPAQTHYWLYRFLEGTGWAAF
jgi:phosphatidylserine/phosphatidylglycerophosphate/cardiolipin synthase-like enzyme